MHSSRMRTARSLTTSHSIRHAYPGDACRGNAGGVGVCVMGGMRGMHASPVDRILDTRL